MRISDWSSDVCSSDLQIETSAGHATKTATAAGILRVYIIGNEHQHRSFPNEWRVAVQVASQMARQQQGLNMWNQSHRHRFAKKRMTKIALLPILPGDQHGLTPVLRERDGSALVDDAIIGLALTPIDQRSEERRVG